MLSLLFGHVARGRALIPPRPLTTPTLAAADINHAELSIYSECSAAAGKLAAVTNVVSKRSHNRQQQTALVVELKFGDVSENIPFSVSTYRVLLKWLYRCGKNSSIYRV